MDEREARAAQDRKAEALEAARRLTKEGHIGSANVAALKGPHAVVVKGFAGSAGAGLVFVWTREGTGYGEVTLSVDPDGVFHVDREGMGDEFCLDVIAQALRETPEQEA